MTAIRPSAPAALRRPMPARAAQPAAAAQPARAAAPAAAAKPATASKPLTAQKTAGPILAAVGHIGGGILGAALGVGVMLIPSLGLGMGGSVILANALPIIGALGGIIGGYWAGGKAVDAIANR